MVRVQAQASSVEVMAQSLNQDVGDDGPTSLPDLGSENSCHLLQLDDMLLESMLKTGIDTGILYGRDFVALSRTCSKFGLPDDDGLSFIDRYIL